MKKTPEKKRRPLSTRKGVPRLAGMMYGTRGSHSCEAMMFMEIVLGGGESFLEKAFRLANTYPREPHDDLDIDLEEVGRACCGAYARRDFKFFQDIADTLEHGEFQFSNPAGVAVFNFLNPGPLGPPPPDRNRPYSREEIQHLPEGWREN